MVLFVSVVLLVVGSTAILAAHYLVVGPSGTNDVDDFLTGSFFAFHELIGEMFEWLVEIPF